jgi:hypothetical protein
MENMVILRLGNFKEVLSSVSLPLSRKMRESLTAFLTSDSIRVARSFRDQESADLAKKEAVAEHNQLQVVRNQELINHASRTVQEARMGSVSMGVISLICFVLCFAAEYVFNQAVMPWLVSVPPTSLLGIALSLAPATAPIILDRVIVALVDVDESWKAIKEAMKPGNGLARHAVRIAFMLAVGAMTLCSIWLLAGARGVASFLRNSESATNVTMLQQGKIDLALLVVSISVTISGALFYLFGLLELRTFFQLRQARRRLSDFQAVQRLLEAERATAAEQLSKARRRWEQIDSLQQSVADAYLAEGMVMLEEKESTPLSARELVFRTVGRLSPVTQKSSADSKSLDSPTLN